jgi:hypothetical protein
MLSLKEKLAKNYINAVGWQTKKKYLVIESDDWGAVRMPSKEVYNELLRNDITVDEFSFDKHDSVESEEDLNALFKTLEKFRDSKGNPPVLTAYHVLANPNFEKIDATNREEYYNETILETYARHTHTKKVPELIKEGMKKGIYIPQYHGREHIHVRKYMDAINSKSEKEKIAFTNRAIISSKSLKDKESAQPSYFKGFAFDNANEHKDIENIHRDGLRIFKDIFGMPSLTFMAQGSVWGDHILSMLKEEGVQLIPGQQTIPLENGELKIINKNWGSKNELGQIHWRRNCMFEPARNQNFDWVNKCLAEINIAFRWGKPAVISSHRENFIGSIFEDNRNQSLGKLEELLEAILKKWPDVKFISSAALAELMMRTKGYH